MTSISSDNYFDANSFIMPNVIEPSGWLEHGSFAMWLIARLRPQIFVELGTHNGFSYFSFAQSVVSNNLTTKMYAIDTWQGDEHAGFYGDQVFDVVSKINSTRYGSFSYLLRNTFDDGLEHFENDSIDLLHIDGLHTYDAVKHDFETWLPKLSENGIVLFHDISVRERGFGVFKLWSEISAKYPSFEFIHGHGLGVLKVGKAETKIDFLFECSQEEVKNIQGMYSSLGRRISLEYELDAQRSRSAASEAEIRYTLSSTQSELSSTQSELSRTQSELSRTQSELSRTQSELSSTQSELSLRLNEFQDLLAGNSALRESISWKLTAPLRNVHSRVKRR
jgi:hypothetical protein